MNDTWDLSILYKDFDDPAFTGDMAALDQAIAAVNALAGEAAGMDHSQLVHRFLQVQEQVEELTNKLFIFCSLRCSANTADTKANSLGDHLSAKLSGCAAANASLRRTVAGLEDLDATFESDPAAASREEIIFAYPGLFAIFVYRIAHLLYCQRVPMIPRIMAEYAHSRTGIDIHPGASIGPHFFIDHGTGIVVGETTVIGRNVKLYQGVTLGAMSPRAGHASLPGKRHPTVGDDVTIYSGASILGGETDIGDGSVVGGNVFLTHSVRSGTRVAAATPAPVMKNPSDPFVYTI